MMGSVIADKLQQTSEDTYPNMDFTWQDRLYIRPRAQSMTPNLEWNVKLASTHHLWRPEALDSEIATTLYSSYLEGTKIEPNRHTAGATLSVAGHDCETL